MLGFLGAMIALSALIGVSLYMAYCLNKDFVR